MTSTSVGLAELGEGVIAQAIRIALAPSASAMMCLAMIASVPSPRSSNRRAQRDISKATPKTRVVSKSNRSPFKYCLMGMARRAGLSHRSIRP